jgi:hypothetical protein
VTATPGNGVVTLSWGAVSGATSYSVYRGTSAGGETLYQSGLSTTTYSDTGVTNGTTYFYQVSAVNAGGQSPRSAEVSATPQPNSPPLPPPNTPPTISDVTDQTIPQNGNTGALSFTVGDAQTAAGSLIVDAQSSNTTLVSVGNIIFGGSGASRTVTVTPTAGQSGTATITLTVHDGGGLTASDTFLLTVTVPPPPPPPPSAFVGYHEFAVGTDAGGSPTARLFNPDGTERFTQPVFDPSFAGGVRTAAADFNADGVADLVVGTGPGVPTRVQVLDGRTRAVIFDTAPFEPTFLGGVYVAAGDLTGDGRADLVITPDEGGGPRVEVVRGGDFHLVANFFGIDDPNFRGGARAAVADLSGDGHPDLVVAAGFGGGPRVAAFDGTSLSITPRHLFGDLFVFEQTLRNGVFVTAGDLDGDGRAELIVGGGPGGGPRVLALSGADLMAGLSDRSRPVANFFAGNTENRGGVRVAVKDLDGDSRADLVVGDGAKAGSHVTAYLGKDFAGGLAPPDLSFDAFPGFTGGVFVG